MRRNRLKSTVGAVALTMVALTSAMVLLLAGGPPAAAATQTFYVTGYSYWDNDPPGSAAIAYPGLHRQAAGQGTYADPITAAVSTSSGIAPGTRFYVPFLRRYVIVEDQCASCGPLWIDLWVDGSANEAVSERCMSAITGNHVVIRGPASGYPVDPGPISTQACARQYGDTVPTLTTTAAPTSVRPTTAAPTSVRPTTTAPTSVRPTTAAPTLTNVARRTDVTVRASSQNWGTGQTAAKAVDGVISGYPAASTAEWATRGGRAGSWIQLTWGTSVRVEQVRLFDRPNLDDRVLAARLRFSDGSTVEVGALVDAGGATTVSFPARRVTSVRVEVVRVSDLTRNVGLAELQVMGRA